MHDDTCNAPATAVYEIINATGRTPVLLVCDHASHRIPSRYANLSLSPTLLRTSHTAWDIGAAAVTRLLAARFDCPALLAGYSRLLIDLNRQPGDPTSIPLISDDIRIPGNQTVTDSEAEFRQEAYFWPYHHALARTLTQLWRHGPAPALVAIHSFTPVFSGLQRPWQIGLLWNHDPRIARPLIQWLRQRQPALCIGDNEPYSGRATGFTVDHHAGAAGLPHVTIEIRQDLITEPAGQAHWAALVGAALEAVLSNESLHQVQHY